MSAKRSKRYQYRLGIEVSKVFAGGMFFLSLILLILFTVFRDKYNVSQIVHLDPIIGAGFGCLFSLYYIGTWCDIKVSDDGLHVEFLWNMLFVPWSEIKQLKYLGFYPIGYWVVHTKNSLTFFHRLYSLGTFSISPSFHIHDSIDDKNELILFIKKSINNKKS